MKRLSFVMVLSFAMALLANACDEGQDAETLRVPTATLGAGATTTIAPTAIITPTATATDIPPTATNTPIATTRRPTATPLSP